MINFQRFQKRTEVFYTPQYQVVMSSLNRFQVFLIG